MMLQPCAVGIGMIRVLDEKIDGLTAGVIASTDTMSSYVVYALGSS